MVIVESWEGSKVGEEGDGPASPSASWSASFLVQRTRMGGV